MKKSEAQLMREAYRAELNILEESVQYGKYKDRDTLDDALERIEQVKKVLRVLG